MAAMSVRLWHGWRRTPLEPVGGPSGPILPGGGFPYFGIIPRGLLTRFGHATPAAQAEDWPRVAPLVEMLDVAQDAAPEPEARLIPWIDAARDLNVLSVGQSADICRTYAADLGGQQGIGRIEALDLWLIKEGYTSSVWRVEIHGSEGVSTVAAVNVARDDEAGEELAASYDQMLAWHKTDPDHVAAPLGIDRQARGGGLRPVSGTVTAHAWVTGRELHARRRSDPGGLLQRAELIEIDGFLADRNTGALQAVGRVLAPAEQEHAWSSLLSFLRRHHRVQISGRVVAPGLEINDGDVVWTGQNLVVVGSNSAPWTPTAAEWNGFLAAPYIDWRPGGPRLGRSALEP